MASRHGILFCMGLLLFSLIEIVCARDPITFVVFMALGFLSYQPDSKPVLEYADVECYTDVDGKDYRGFVSQTISGLTCQIWTSQTPHLHLRLPSLYPATGIGEHNYCRNPDGHSTPWCYTTDSYQRWDYCHVGFPSDVCHLNILDDETSLDFTEYLKIIAAICLPYIGGVLSSFFIPSKSSSPGWYQSLRKPCILPPSWVLGPMWTYLYISMGYASYLVWRHGGGFDGAMLPLGLYVLSLLFNWIWGPIFFGYHKLGLACVVILSYLATAGATVYTFWEIDETAGYLLLPLIGWLSLACMFSIYTWYFNRKIRLGKYRHENDFFESCLKRRMNSYLKGPKQAEKI
ncbi:uncharacterized protein [Amphiura filiformis]|uniref:uncharacterized protein n=1 Tax=Amphiura filiformis TaxID=82378 RepID=UPI003B211A1D